MNDSAPPFSSQFSSHRDYTKLYIPLFIVGLLLRWIALDARPVHHDESLHYMYGRYFFDFPEQNFHHYDPMLHGPLLYNSLRLVYDTFGSSTWAGRAFIAILGSLFMLVPLLFRRFFRPLPLFLFTAALVLSPTLIFWTRFLREDMLMIWATTLVFYGAILAPAPAKPVWILIGIALQWCIKANMFVHAAIVLGFMLFELLFNRVVHKKWDGLLLNLLSNVVRHEGFVTFGFLIGAFLFTYFYTSGYRYSEGILDGLYRKSLKYWWGQHEIERIPGPFLFHVYQLSWYELVFILAVICQIVSFYRVTLPWIRWAGAATIVISGAFALYISGANLETDHLSKFFRLKDSLDAFALLPLIVQPVLVTVHHLLRRERGLAFFGYLFFTLLFTYSYLGEKVPWLAIYPFLGGVIYLTLYFQWRFSAVTFDDVRAYPWSKVLRFCGVVLATLGIIFLAQERDSFFRNLPGDMLKEAEQLYKEEMYGSWLRAYVSMYLLGALKNAPVLLLGLLMLLCGYLESKRRMLGTVNVLFLLCGAAAIFNLRAAIMVNFINGGAASEFMSQVHTTKEFHDFVTEIRHQIEVPTLGRKPTVYVTGEATWPSTWYFVDLPEFKFNATPEELKHFDYRIENLDPDKNKQTPGFKRVDMTLRGWWVPEYNQMNLKKFLLYSLSQKPWSPTGFSYVTVLVKDKG